LPGSTWVYDDEVRRDPVIATQSMAIATIGE
jgi:hypothetical protein